MLSKLKAVLSKVAHLSLVRDLASKIFQGDPRAIAGKFYLKALPRMTTMPKVPDTAPSVNLWLWVIGYLRLQWPGVEGKPRKILGPETHAKLLHLFKELRTRLPEKLTKVKNLSLVKSIIQDTSISHRTKKWRNR